MVALPCKSCRERSLRRLSGLSVLENGRRSPRSEVRYFDGVDLAAGVRPPQQAGDSRGREVEALQQATHPQTTQKERKRAMSYDESTVEEDVSVDDSEAPEAEGVSGVEMEAAPLGAEDAATLDRETVEGLDEQERAELGAGASGAEAGGAVALSANFVLAEFHCCRGHCAGASVPSSAVPALRRLVTQVLQPMRDRFGVCRVFSGYRNSQHNGHVGGVENSHHRYDVRPNAPAADVAFASGTVNEWAAEARRLLGGSIGGVDRYPSQGFIHVDLGAARKWSG
jgi:hypothetical protein